MAPWVGLAGPVLLLGPGRRARYAGGQLRACAGTDLSQLDGWADLPDEAIKITGMNSELYDVYEIEPAGASTR